MNLNSYIQITNLKLFYEQIHEYKLWLNLQKCTLVSPLAKYMVINKGIEMESKSEGHQGNASAQ